MTGWFRCSWRPDADSRIAPARDGQATVRIISILKMCDENRAIEDAPPD
jgi:hypothetical protein